MHPQNPSLGLRVNLADSAQRAHVDYDVVRAEVHAVFEQRDEVLRRVDGEVIDTRS